MNSAKDPIAVTMVVVLLVSCGCPFLVTETKAELSNLTLCEGWDAEGNPIVLPDVVPPDQTHICICGHLQTNQDVYLQVLWLGQGSVLLSHQQVFDSGPLLSCAEEEIFEPGQYRVIVLKTKKELGYVDFSMAEGQ